MRNILLGGVASLVFAGLGTSSIAQQTQASSSTPTIGNSSPVAPSGFQTEASVSMNILYNSNVARSDEELAAARGLTLADEMFTPALNFNIGRPVGPATLFVQGFASYLFHRVNTVLNSQSTNVVGGADAHFLSCDELLTGAYTGFQSDLTELSANVTSNTVNSESVALKATCGGAVGFAPTATVSETWLTNSNILVQPNNSNTFSATGGLSYRQPSIGTLTAFGSFSQATFPNQPIGFGQNYGYQIYSGGVTYDRRLGRVEGSASLSYTSLVPNTAAAGGFQGLTYAVNGTYRMSPRLTLHAVISRATTPSSLVGSSYSVSEVYGGDVTYQMNTRISFQLLGSNTSIHYLGQLNQPDTAATNSVTNSVFAVANYKLNRRLSFSLNVGGNDYTVNIPGSNYTDVQAGLTVTATY